MSPDRRLERAFARREGGLERVAGVDEAGRGPLAGPVVAAAVVWPRDRKLPTGLNDSKQVAPARRGALFHQLLAGAECVGVGLATAREIDTINILEATRLASRRALAALTPPPQGVVTDALTLPGCPWPVEPVVKGDCRCASVAAASIVAKVLRDWIMDHYAREYPGYGWEHNRGYGTAGHLAAIEALGPTTLHRMTFAGVGFFTERLRPSQTFQRMWGAGKKAAAETAHFAREREAWSWKLSASGAVAAPRIQALLQALRGESPLPDDDAMDAISRMLLAEAEAEALEAAAAAAGITTPPAWL